MYLFSRLVLLKCSSVLPNYCSFPKCRLRAVPFWSVESMLGSSFFFVRSLCFALARPVEGLLATARSLSELSEVFPGNFSYFSDFYSISVILIFFENFSHSKALTNIYILIREVLEKQTTTASCCIFSFKSYATFAINPL